LVIDESQGESVEEAMSEGPFNKSAFVRAKRFRY